MNKFCGHCNKEFETKRSWCTKVCSDCRPIMEKIRQKGYKKGYIVSGYNAYTQMKQRCENPNSKDYIFYGAKGIKIDISLEDFCHFYNISKYCDMCSIELNQDKTSGTGKCVDRIDSSKNYYLHNIRILCRSCNTKISCINQDRGYRGRYVRTKI